MTLDTKIFECVAIVMSLYLLVEVLRHLVRPGMENTCSVQDGGKLVAVSAYWRLVQ